MHEHDGPGEALPIGSRQAVMRLLRSVQVRPVATGTRSRSRRVVMGPGKRGGGPRPAEHESAGRGGSGKRRETAQEAQGHSAAFRNGTGTQMGA